MTNRQITDDDRAKAQRLKALWSDKKEELGLTQVKAAKTLGYSQQSMVSQQLNCKVALNTDGILKWAQLLRVDPSQIDPALGKLGISTGSLRRVRVPILARISGERPEPFETMEIITQMTRQIYGVTVDTDGFEPFAKKGSTIMVSSEEEPVSGDEVFIRFEYDGGFINMIKRYIATDKSREVAVVAGLTDNVQEELPLSRIDLFDPIVSVERPIVNRPVRLRAKELTK